ncbi:MAG: outer membrane protein assembly factor BamD [Candidatus Binatota bacterium]|nr:outer membrane protein assembly factor BamD [Candidatus Binatota bacterium]
MPKITITLILALSVMLPACSSISLPSLPWSGSALKTDPTAEALFEEGTRNFNDKKYVRAIDSFTKIKTDHPFSPLVTQAELKVADAHYLNEQFPEAINLFKEFQDLHPTSEHLPFVTLRLGQAYFDQFTAIDREQKNTELAKGYFEAVITKYPKSPQAAIAKTKLAQAIEYLAEHEFSAAEFYFKQQKFAAARDRFEEIVRKYRDTPTAVKSLYFLGESYRQEKNGPRATLAYEALIQRYPQSKYAADARTQLALVEKEKRDPLDLLLMRDRRPGAAPAPEVKEDPALAKLKDLNLVAKNEVVHEEPGAEKGFFRRVTDKINPFSSSSNSNSSETKPQSALDLLAKKNETAKQESGGLLSSLWPFGSNDSKPTAKSNEPKPSGLIAGVDQSLQQKGIDSQSRQATLKAPAADLPKPDAAPPAPTDTRALLGSIDANLQKSGTNPNQTPTPPAAAAAFSDSAIVQAAVAQAAEANQKTPSAPVNEVLSSIDQKLRAKGVEPAKFEVAPSPAQVKEATVAKPQPKTVELEPKLALEKGPLYLSPSETQPRASAEPVPSSAPSPASEPKQEAAARSLVKGPVQAQASVPGQKPAVAKTPGQDDAPPSAFGQIQQDLEKASKILNPFNW